MLATTLPIYCTQLRKQRYDHNYLYIPTSYSFPTKAFHLRLPFTGHIHARKLRATNWVLPLAAHAAVHATATFLIAIWFSLHLAIILAIADFILHFTIDRLKASPNYGGRFKPDQPYFWWALGADQMAHHFTHYAFIFILLGAY